MKTSRRSASIFQLRSAASFSNYNENIVNDAFTRWDYLC